MKHNRVTQQRQPPSTINSSTLSVAIVGRSNVGKSSLFNRLQGKQGERAIVFDVPGTTREGKRSVCEFGSLTVEWRDTGGIEDDELTSSSEILSQMREKVQEAVATADAVVFVYDAHEGVTGLDLKAAEWIKETLIQHTVAHLHNQPESVESIPHETPVILIANKSDQADELAALAEGWEMGLGEPILVSAKMNLGIEDLYDRLMVLAGRACPPDEEGMLEEDPSTKGLVYDRIEARWLRPGEDFSEVEQSPMELNQDCSSPISSAYSHDYSASESAPESASESPFNSPSMLTITLAGRPNTGKSSLVNALLRQHKAIVSSFPGTTVDSLSFESTFDRHPVRLIDTAGISKGWKFPQQSDFKQPVMETARAMRQADVVLIAIDAPEVLKGGGGLNRHEMGVAKRASDEGRCVAIAVNKWDMIPAQKQKFLRRAITEKVERSFAHVKGLPVIFVSAKTGFNLGLLMTKCLALSNRWSTRIPTPKLNAWLRAFVTHFPPPWKNQMKCHVKYVTQTGVRPPSFVMWTNVHGEFPDNYLNQLKTALREEFNLMGPQIVFMIRTTFVPKAIVRALSEGKKAKLGVGAKNE